MAPLTVARCRCAPPHLTPLAAPPSNIFAGVIALTKTIAREYAGRNITCNAVAPGFIASGELKQRWCWAGAVLRSRIISARNSVHCAVCCAVPPGLHCVW